MYNAMICHPERSDRPEVPDPAFACRIGAGAESKDPYWSEAVWIV